LQQDEQAGKADGEVDQISWLAKPSELIKIAAGGKTFALVSGNFNHKSEK